MKLPEGFSASGVACGLKPSGNLDLGMIVSDLRDFYGDTPFVHISDAPPATKHVAGTNYCIVHPTISPTTGRVVIASAIDNLGKGAAGNVVQCKIGRAHV